MMIWLLYWKKGEKNICNFLLLMAPASYFQMTHIDPEKCWSDYLDPLRGTSALGFLPGIWGRQWLECFSMKAALCLPCVHSCHLWGRLPRQVFSSVSQIPASYILWSLLYCFQSVFACMNLTACEVGRSLRDRHHFYSVDEKTEA